MWWTKKGSDAYKQLWRLIYQRAQLAGVDNVLWVFNGMAGGQSTPMSSWYPGDSYVDVVASDYYQSYADFGSLMAVGTNRTLGVAETFSPLNPSSDPAWPYFVVWASRDWPRQRQGRPFAVEDRDGEPQDHLHRPAPRHDQVVNHPLRTGSPAGSSWEVPARRDPAPPKPLRYGGPPQARDLRTACGSSGTRVPGERGGRPWGCAGRSPRLNS
ncbi:hypothetical protein GSF24_02675 [Microbispora triticiradicis]|nr:hypothetical protein [Microbispora triticiradicis]